MNAIDHDTEVRTEMRRLVQNGEPLTHAMVKAPANVIGRRHLLARMEARGLRVVEAAAGAAKGDAV
jgi:hypothetical protein